MDDLVKEFIAETMESLGELDFDLVKLEQNPSDQELLGKVFRLMHTIKGTCGFIGLPRLEKTAHAGENLLENFRSGKMDIGETSMTLLFMCIDRVRFLVSEVANTGREPDGEDSDIIEAIEKDIEEATCAPQEVSETEEAQEEKTPDVKDTKAPEISPDDIVFEDKAAINVDVTESAEDTPISSREFDDDIEEAMKEYTAELDIEHSEGAQHESKEALTNSDINPTEDQKGKDTAQILPETTSEKVPAAKNLLKFEPKTEQKSDAGTPEKGPEFLRVQMSVLEDLINMVSELVLTRNQLLQLVRMEEGSTLNAPLQRLNRIVSDLQDNVMKTRMQPIGNAWSKLPRIVRDLSSEMGKKITLEMQGEETELDRQVLELIKDPLTHMVRNSCDHGIEMPQNRSEVGKPEGGTIKLHAYHEGGFIIIKISDDGRGLDPTKIAAKAVQCGLIDPEALDHMTEKQIFNCIMKPGFSTAEQVTSVSGRGVGMDVVRANIEKIGGSIDMDSTTGEGTSFTIRIPLTLAIISALIVEIDGYRYALPQMNIQELVSLGDTHGDTQDDMIEYISDKPVLRLRDRIIPLLNSDVLFHLKQSGRITHENKENEHKSIAVISTGSGHYGIVVDRIYDTEEVVIKSISSVLKDANIFSGNTILGDGQVIMILDPAAIARKHNVDKEISQVDLRRFSDAHEKRRLQENASMLVFKAGKGPMKTVPLAMVSRLQVFPASEIDTSGDKMIVRFNDDLMQLAYIEPENQSLDGEEITTIILSDDRSESAMGLVIDKVIDIADGTLDIVTSTKRPGVIGSMILSSSTVDVIDVSHFLSMCRSNWFSSNTHAMSSYVHELEKQTLQNRQMQNPGTVANDRGGYVEAKIKLSNTPQKAGDRLRLLVVDDSSFFRNMLHPILTAAGYHVTLAEDALHAIRMHDQGYQFDIIISDIEMPGMNGCEFVEKMRKESAWKDKPFIAITSHNTQEDIEYGYQKGFDQYIGKFDKDELINSLKSVKVANG